MVPEVVTPDWPMAVEGLWPWPHHLWPEPKEEEGLHARRLVQGLLRSWPEPKEEEGLPALGRPARNLLWAVLRRHLGPPATEAAQTPARHLQAPCQHLVAPVPLVPLRPFLPSFAISMEPPHCQDLVQALGVLCLQAGQNLQDLGQGQVELYQNPCRLCWSHPDWRQVAPQVALQVVALTQVEL
jgi:hypothetical protein